MRYGYFDDIAREYVVERPDTPVPWINYIGSRRYGGIITNNAAGYSFFRSPAKGRILRFRYNAPAPEMPGRFFYIRDRDTGEYWSASWQPCGRPLDEYSSVCRFGTGYATIDSQYRGIRSESTYMVPLDGEHECWRLRITNTSAHKRRLSIFTYCEFTSEWNIFQDLLNLQYSGFIVRAEYADGMIRCSSLGNIRLDTDDFSNGDQGRWWWMAMTGARIAGYDCDRESFLGSYGTLATPQVVHEGRCRGSVAYGGNACGCLQADVEISSDECHELLILLGAGDAEREGREAIANFAGATRFEEEIARIKTHWHQLITKTQVISPDPEFDHMINMWGAYNALVTYDWCRSCSLSYTGDQREGFGYRDAAQDVLGALPYIDKEARKRLDLLLSGQENCGCARPEINPVTHKPGKMTTTPLEQVRSDDMLWIFLAARDYIAETGDFSYLQYIIPYADYGSDTVLNHLKKALTFSLGNVGRHGLPCGLLADWNDCLKLGYKGESTFVAFQLRLAFSIYAGMGRLAGQYEEERWALEQQMLLDGHIQDHAWDDRWFLRAFNQNGSVIGSRQNTEGKIFLNPQSWAVISRAAKARQAIKCLNSVYEHLYSPAGLMLCSPPFVTTGHEEVRAVLFNPGEKENGGIFSQAQPWAVMADCILGNGTRAYELFRSFMPAAKNEHVQHSQAEPYVYCQSTSSPLSMRSGRSHLPWLTGAASWAQTAAIQYILGIRPEYEGLRIDPCIPANWPAFRVRRMFRGCMIDITVNNPHGLERGIQELIIAGKTIEGNLLPDRMIEHDLAVQATMRDMQ